MTQPSIPDKPEYGSVESYLEMFRKADAEGHDIYPYAFGVATQTASTPSYSAEEKVRRISNMDAAITAIEDDRRAQWEAMPASGQVAR